MHIRVCVCCVCVRDVLQCVTMCASYVLISLCTAMTEMWGAEKTNTSRLACQITLQQKHDGMVVFVPSPPLTDMCI